MLGIKARDAVLRIGHNEIRVVGMGIRMRKEQALRPLLKKEALHPRDIDVKADIAEEEQEVRALDFRQKERKRPCRAERLGLLDIVEFHTECSAVSEVGDDFLLQMPDHKGGAPYAVALQLFELPFE